MSDEPVIDTCHDCGKEIDLATCWCGDGRDAHAGYEGGHSFVPMGCECCRSTTRSSLLDGER